MILEDAFAHAERSQQTLLEATIQHARNADREVARAKREAEKASESLKQTQYEHNLQGAELARYKRFVCVLEQLVKSGPISRDELIRHLSVLKE